MFRTIKDEEFSRIRLGGDEFGILRHVTRSIDFSFVGDRLDNLDARFGDGVGSNLCISVAYTSAQRSMKERNAELTSTSLIVIFDRQFLRRFREMDGRDLDRVSLPLGVGADEESVDRIVLPGRTTRREKCELDARGK